MILSAGAGAPPLRLLVPGVLGVAIDRVGKGRRRAMKLVRIEVESFMIICRYLIVRGCM